VASVSILKKTVSPRFTLISVVKPRIVRSIGPLRSQSVEPGFVFSQATGSVIGGSQGSANAPAAPPAPSRMTAASVATGAGASERGRRLVSGHPEGPSAFDLENIVPLQLPSLEQGPSQLAQPSNLGGTGGGSRRHFSYLYDHQCPLTVTKLVETWRA